METKKYSLKLLRLEAVQYFVDDADPSKLNNAQELVDWCGGVIQWEYSGILGDHNLTAYVIEADKRVTLNSGDWVVRYGPDDFRRMSDEEFTDKFDTDGYVGPVVCWWCLSDSRYTPTANPTEKACPICGVRYSGPERRKEYEYLLLSGIVQKEE